MSAGWREWLALLGDVQTVLAAGGALLVAAVAAYLWLSGIAPVVLRLGLGLSRRRVALFAKGDALGRLEELLADSRLFRRRNVVRIAHRGDLGRAARCSVFLIHYPDWSEGPALAEIMRHKADATALIVYAPQGAGRVSPEFLDTLERQRHAVLCNFRGRLLNDLVVSMITTGYERT